MSRDGRAANKLLREIESFDRTFPELRSMPKEVREHLVLTGRKNRVWLKPMWWLRWTYPGLIYIAWCVLYAQLPPGRITHVLDSAVLISLLYLVFYSLNLATRHYKSTHVHNELTRIELRPPVCFICGYDLRGTPDESTSCPECGAEIAKIETRIHSDSNG